MSKNKCLAKLLVPQQSNSNPLANTNDNILKPQNIENDHLLYIYIYIVCFCYVSLTIMWKRENNIYRSAGWIASINTSTSYSHCPSPDWNKHWTDAKQNQPILTEIFLHLSKTALHSFSSQRKEYIQEAVYRLPYAFFLI